MSSEPIRDPKSDQLLTPQNAAFIIIDYQPVQVNSIASMERQRLVSNIVRACKTALTYGLPIVHSTVNVESGINKPPIAALREVLGNIPTYDPTRSTHGRTSSSAKQWKRLAARSSSWRHYGPKLV